MSDSKFWFGFVSVLVIAMLGGFAVHGYWLAPDYASLTDVMRPEEGQQERFHFMLLAHVSVAFAFTWIYRQGRKDGDWMGQGLRYALLIALVANIPFFMIYHTVAKFPMALMIKQIVGDVVVLILAGLAVARIHK